MKITFFQYFLTFCLSIFFASCEKTDRPITGGGSNTSGQYTISGRFYQNCSGQPLANTTFLFWQPGVGGHDLGTATTDATGNFSFSYTPTNGATVLYGKQNQYGYIEYGQIQAGTYRNIELFAVPTCYIKVSLQVYNNSYTNRDTMLVGDFGKNGGIPIVSKIPGPFTSGPMFDVPNYSILNYSYNGTYLARATVINNISTSYGGVKMNPCDTVNYIIEVR